MAKFRANTDDAYILTNIQNQESGDSDWAKYQVVTKDKSRLILHNNTTNSLLKVNKYGYTTQVHDIFGDGSAVATYTFDGNANDLGGNYNGTLYGNPTFDTGKFGQAIKLDGTDDYVDTGYIHQGNAVTVSLWINLNDNTSQQFIFADHSSSADITSRVVLRINYNANKFGFMIGDNSTSWKDNSIDHNLEIGIWYHLVYVVNNTSVKLYKDSQLVADLTSSVALSNANHSLIIGRCGAYNAALYTNGLIDQVRIFNRALTEDEVVFLYHEGLTHIRKHDQLIIYNATDGAKIHKITSITDNDTDKTYDIDISSLSLTEAPTNAHQLTKSVDLTDKLIDSDTTANNVVLKHHLVGPTIIKNKEPIVVYNPTDGFKKKDDTIVTRELVSTVNIHDIFNDNSAIATYTLDGNANDLGGNYNGTWSGTEQYDTGVFGQAAKFDGSSQVDCGVINTDLDELWISFWMYWNGGTGEMPIGFYNYDLFLQNDFFGWNTANSDIYGIDFPSSSYANKWLHIVVNFKTGAYGDSLYINTERQILEQKKGSINSNNAVIKNIEFHIGNRGGDNAYRFNGLIDQVRIFNRALIEDEVKYLFYEQYLKYNIDISSLNLTTKPTSVYIVKPRVEISVGDEDKANADDLVLDVDTNNTTTTQIVTNYMSVNDSQRTRIKNIEKIDTNTELDIQVINVTEEGDGGSPEKFKYTIELAEAQSSVPTKAIIRPTIQDILELDPNNTAYDNTNDLVNVYYQPIEKGNGFRSIQVKWNAHRRGDENSSLRVNLWKKVA